MTLSAIELIGLVLLSIFVGKQLAYNYHFSLKAVLIEIIFVGIVIAVLLKILYDSCCQKKEEKHDKMDDSMVIKFGGK